MSNYFERLPTFVDNDFFHFALKWAPRAIFSGLAGYYSLGIAYEKGIMATIDRLAIQILRHSMGYAGIGVFMPTFQWYSSWSIRLLAVIGAGIVYDLIERVVQTTYSYFSSQNENKHQKNLTLTPYRRTSIQNSFILKQAPKKRFSPHYF